MILPNFQKKKIKSIRNINLCKYRWKVLKIKCNNQLPNIVKRLTKRKKQSWNSKG